MCFSSIHRWKMLCRHRAVFICKQSGLQFDLQAVYKNIQIRDSILHHKKPDWYMKIIPRFPSAFPSLEAPGSGENRQKVAGRQESVGTQEHINTFQDTLFLEKVILAIRKTYSSHCSAAHLKVLWIYGLSQKWHWISIMFSFLCFMFWVKHQHLLL